MRGKSTSENSSMKQCWLALAVLVPGLAFGGGQVEQQIGRQPLVFKGENKLSDQLEKVLASRFSGEFIKVWIYLVDKGDSTSDAYTTAVITAKDRLTPRARRRLALRGGRLSGWEDLPVHSSYVEDIKKLGVRDLKLSRWINAASVSAAPDVIYQLAELPFVIGIETVKILRRPEPLEPPQNALPESIFNLRNVRTNYNNQDYGPSLNQVNQLQIPELHDLGLTGKGVLVALFDTGFNLEHVAFDSLKTRVESQRDFIESNDGFNGSAFAAHGTQVLSIIGGYAPGHLVGPAYGASYLLASTEAIAFENEIEEDWWITAMEWADSLGVDVISSSLGYTDWYTYADMDGKTAPISRAASIAVDRGIVVVNAMGNLGGLPYEKMGAPADAEKVISVGAVNLSGSRVEFSSIGPTFDGRIKPDVMAMGQNVYTVDPYSATNYLRADGTSFSTPLVAGVAALLFEAYPSWTPSDIHRVLRKTSSQAVSPDTLNGYGIVHALDALMTEARGTVHDFTADSGPNGILLSWTADLEINLLSYRVERREYPSGSFEQIASIAVTQTSGSLKSENDYSYTDTTVVEGVSYEYRLETEGREGLLLKATSVSTRSTYALGTSRAAAVKLFPNAPNPFDNSTKINFELTVSSRVILTIYNLLGQKIRVLIDRMYGPGSYECEWNGRDSDGRSVPSGVYYYRMTVGNIEKDGKMLLLR